MIHTVIEKHDLKQMVSYLCRLVGVFRSGYYRYFSDEAAAKRQTDHQADETVKDIILKAIHFRRRAKGGSSDKNDIRTPVSNYI